VTVYRLVLIAAVLLVAQSSTRAATAPFAWKAIVVIAPMRAAEELFRVDAPVPTISDAADLVTLRDAG
jgi:hypothetical protein